MLVVIVLVLLLFVAGIALLAVYLGRRSAGGRGRAVGMCAGIAACIVAAGIVLDHSGVYYVRPLGWWILLVALLVAAAALVVLVARGAGRGIGRALALTGLVVLSVVLAMGAIGMNELLELTPYPWEARARQVGEAAGFKPLLAGGRLPGTRGTERIALLAGPDLGLVMGYEEGFQVLQRRAPEVMDEAAMRGMAAVGEDPLTSGAVTPGATYKMIEVGGRPALMAQWQPEIPGGGSMTETVTMLLFKVGDTDVRVWSSQVYKPAAGGTSPDYGMRPEALIEAAGTLRPME